MLALLPGRSVTLQVSRQWRALAANSAAAASAVAAAAAPLVMLFRAAAGCVSFWLQYRRC